MRDDDFSELLDSVRQMVAMRRGELEPGAVTEFPAPNVARLREAMGLTQAQLAALLGVSLRTVQDWEQGRRSPRGPARALLRVAEYSPQTVLEAMAGTRVPGRGRRRKSG